MTADVGLAAAAGIVGGTFVSEDLALISALGLARQELLSWPLALGASLAGIYVGDLFLFYAGKSGGKWVSPTFLPRSLACFVGDHRNGGWAVFLARFLPGARVITYVSAGAAGMSTLRFAWITGVAVSVWVLAIALLGRAIPAPWIAAGLGVALLAGWISRPNPRQRARLAFYRLLRHRHFEFWPMGLFYFPVVIYGILLAVRHRSVRAPMDANPGIPNGGILGESKAFILERLPVQLDARLRFTAIDLRAEDSVGSRRAVLDWMSGAGLSFPIILKPDIGQRGAGVSLIRNDEGLARYVTGRGFRVIAQEYCPFTEEVGVNYRRFPGQATGRITGVTRKRFPFITGDGVKSATELVLDDPRARYMAAVYLDRHDSVRDRVLAVGERLKLVESGNHCQGAIFEDGRSLITPELEAALDRIAREIPELYTGRFDLRFQDEGALGSGRGFKIIECNAGSGEATHIYDARTSLWNAYRTLFSQLRDLFLIGVANQRRGVFAKTGLLRSALHFRRVSRQYPPTT